VNTRERIAGHRLVGPSPGLQAWTDYFFKVAWRLLGIAAGVITLVAGEPVLHLVQNFAR
jgi:hypothetical protein